MNEAPNSLVLSRACIPWVAVAAVVLSCTASPDGPQIGSETHFLEWCDGDCPAGTACHCGVCTNSCSASDECRVVEARASCFETLPRVAQGRCAADTVPAVCDVGCLLDGDCSSLGSSYLCLEGFCRVRTGSPPEVTPPADHCEPSGVAPDQLLVLGDSLIELTPFTASLEERAVAAGVLPEGDHFRQAASAMRSFLADEGSLSIGSQYLDAREQGPIRIVVMDGGETDMFEGLCDSDTPHDCPVVQDAARGAQGLFDQMRADGVEQAVYFFYPDPVDVPYLKDALDVLRPILANACGQSPVPCHWVDLRPQFAGHPEFLAQDGMLFSEEGAQVAAAAVWERMRQRCIAQ